MLLRIGVGALGVNRAIVGKPDEADARAARRGLDPVQTAVRWRRRVKVRRRSADGQDVVFPLALLTAAYFAAVIWLRRKRRDAAAAGVEQPADLPVEDRPPPTAVGWPPGGRSFASYVDDGFAAIDAWLSEGHAA